MNLPLRIFAMAVSLSAQTIEVADIVSVRASGDPVQWVHSVAVPPNPPVLTCEVLIAGAGMGGVAATLAALDRGHSVCLTDPTSWLGGQMTSGGVSALDENKFIEISGATRTYREMRNRIRAKYNGIANPGGCYVSSLCFEPKVGVQVLDEMLRERTGKLTWLPRSDVIQLTRDGARIAAALVYSYAKRSVTRVNAQFYLDATEMGDLLPLAKVPYIAGSESQAQTGEPHAPPEANAACAQSFTYPFILERRTSRGAVSAKPEGYEKIRDHQPFSLTMNYPVQLGWKGSFTYTMFGDDAAIPNNMSPRPFFSWRRVRNLPGATELALMNWPRQDYHDQSLLDRSALDTARAIQAAKRVSFSFLHWLQEDNDHPELQLVIDAMGSEDGLAQYPYVREARRLKTALTVTEQDIVSEYQPDSRARNFPSSIGTGFYMVDIHPCGANEQGRMMMPRPFQVPVELLLPQGVDNLLAAGKNIGVTHITNGAFRLHPIEWNIGEAAGMLASLRLKRQNETDLQPLLAARGVPMAWFDDLPVEHPRFAAIQLAALRGVYPMSRHDLHASADAPITRSEAAQALAALFLNQRLPAPAATAIAIERGWMAVDHRNWFHGDLPLYWTDLRRDKLPNIKIPENVHRPALRGEFSSTLMGLRD